MRTTRFIRDHIELIGSSFFIIFQIVAIFMGISLFVIGGINLHVTMHALIMFSYKAIQKVLAYKWIRYSMAITREPFLNALAQVASREEFELAEPVVNQYRTLDNVRHNLFEQLIVNEDQWRKAVSLSFGENLPPVSVTVPIYDIEHEILAMQVESIAKQTYPNLHKVYLGVNDANDWGTVHYLENLVRDKYADAPMEFVVLVEGNPGKRKVQNTMFLQAIDDGCELVWHTDGDTFADMDAASAQVHLFLNDPRIGITTGDVRVIVGKDANLLVRVTGMKYFWAFWDERAAQSQAVLIGEARGEMICPSGPNFMIRTSILSQVRVRWFTDTFAGKKLTFGDDRDMGYRVLKAGYKAVFAPDSAVWTDCPSDMKTYEVQQTRWNKSAIIYNLKMYLSGLWHKLSFFVRYTILYLTFYPFLVLAAIGFVLIMAMYSLLTGDYMGAVNLVVPYVVSVIVVHFVFYSSSGIILMRDWKFLLAPVYPYYWLRVQPRARWNAFKGLGDRGWGTRKPRS